MLIESYVIGFAEVKRCIASLRPNDFVVVSENIFMLRENATAQPVDLLADSTPSNHPEADLLDDLIGSAKIANIDGITVKTVTIQGVLLAKQQQQKRFEEHQEVLKRSMAVFRKDMFS